MLKIDRQKKSFSRLESPKLVEVAITERSDLQEYICNSPEAFFEEIGQTLFLIGKEVQPSDDVDDRIDLLAVDKEGQAVIIELKRGNHKLQMFQAISYAGMIAKWQPDDFFELLDAEKSEKLTDFLVDREEINRHQRIILIAEAFDFSVLVGAEWLSEQHGVDIICCRLSLAKDVAANTEFLVCSNVFPAPELVQQAIRRGRSRTGVIHPPKYSDWNSALSNVSNAALVAFYKKELAAGRDNYLRKRYLQYRIAGKRRWFIAARRQRAYVWQHGRFDGDIDFWRSGLNQPEQVKPVKDDRCLSFSLITEADFSFFRLAATEKLLTATWTEGGDEPEVDVDGQEDT